MIEVSYVLFALHVYLFKQSFNDYDNLLKKASFYKNVKLLIYQVLLHVIYKNYHHINV